MLIEPRLFLADGLEVLVQCRSACAIGLEHEGQELVWPIANSITILPVLVLLRVLRCHQWKCAGVDRLGSEVGVAVGVCGGDVADGVAVDVVEERAVWSMVGAVGSPMLLLV